MSVRHDVKHGDTPTLRWSLGRDITGQAVRLIVADRAGTLAVNASATVDDAVLGIISYTLPPTLAIGTYRVEVELTKSGVVLTAPTVGQSTITVSADLG